MILACQLCAFIRDFDVELRQKRGKANHRHVVSELGGDVLEPESIAMAFFPQQLASHSSAFETLSTGRDQVFLVSKSLS